MPSTCCSVPLCSNRGGHSFPLDNCQRKKWLIAIRRDLWTPKKSSLVCKDHFKEDDYIQITHHGSKPLQDRLKSGAVPSKFPWSQKESEATLERLARHKKRLEQKLNLLQTPDAIDIANEVELCTEDSISSDGDSQLVESNASSLTQRTTVSTTTQTLSNMPQLCIERFFFNDKAIHYYTGLESYSKFDMVFATLGAAVNHLQYRNRQTEIISPINQFLLTVIKLRRNTPDYELALNFDISEFSVSNIFVTWINFIYCQWQEIDIWPSRELVSFFMPDGFKNHFPSTRIILDGVEMPIKKPSATLAQQITYSAYKERNTLKMVVGASPGGLITSIPKAYGGSASDRSLVEIGDLCSKCNSGDSIMADKGFDIQDMFASKNVKMNIPTFMKGMNQLPGIKLRNDRKISSKRIHIERLIGLCKTYKMLQSPMPLSYAQLGSRIIFNCFMLCNFRQCIVDKTA